MDTALIKVAKELNVGMGTIVEFLYAKGFSIDNKPNGRVSEDMYAVLLKKFSGSKVDKEKADELVFKTKIDRIKVSKSKLIELQQVNLEKPKVINEIDSFIFKIKPEFTLTNKEQPKPTSPIVEVKLQDINKALEEKEIKINVINVWHPINFSTEWESCNTRILDSILPSWTRRRETLKESSKEFQIFQSRLKRQHAIETGIVEKLYDLKEGVTETFVKEGFIESYLQHGDTNIPPKQLMNYLQDNFEAIDWVFDVVKEERPLSESFIKQLHQLIVKHQDSAEGRDQFGHRLLIPLLKGAYKERENNPTRADGTRFEYCPPIHVDSEMNNFIQIYDALVLKKENPVIIATWVHHAFTQIHPFQDGNGRLARLLASLVLIKNNLFPLTVKRTEKPKYITALENADVGEPQLLVDFFCETQKKNIEAALNLKIELELSKSSFDEVSAILSNKLAHQKLQKEIKRQRIITKNRESIFNFCEEVIISIKRDLEVKLNGNASIYVTNSHPDSSDKAHYFSRQIVAYATKFGYFFNRTLPKGWFRFVIELSERKKYQLIITLHHFGYDDSTVAIGAILEYNESRDDKEETALTLLPLSIEPITISVDDSNTQLENSFDDIYMFLHNSVTLTLGQIASELN